jgi:hypothetical protein
MTLVAAEDASRPIWPGCPSSGWHSGVHRLTGLPNGKPLASTVDAEISVAAEQTSAAAVAIASSESSDAPSCTFQPNTGYQNAAGGRKAVALTKEACCEKCWADKYCVIGVFEGATCWMKYENSGKVHKEGVVACVTTKTPHPPPKAHRIETHGPYQPADQRPHFCTALLGQRVLIWVGFARSIYVRV